MVFSLCPLNTSSRYSALVYRLEDSRLESAANTEPNTVTVEEYSSSP